MRIYRLVDAGDTALSTFEAVDDEDAAALGRAAVERSAVPSSVYAVQHLTDLGWTDVVAWVPRPPRGHPVR